MMIFEDCEEYFTRAENFFDIKSLNLKDGRV